MHWSLLLAGENQPKLNKAEDTDPQCGKKTYKENEGEGEEESCISSNHQAVRSLNKESHFSRQSILT